MANPTDQKKDESDLSLADFLVRLATEDDLRKRFNEDRAAVLEKENLSKDALSALLTRNQAELIELLELSNQNADPLRQLIKKMSRRK